VPCSRVFIVTGSNSGIGYAAIKHLADHHAYCIMATRNGDRAVDAIQSIRGRDGVTNGTIKYMHLDLASLSSIKSFASEFKATGLPLHGLVCNAGVMVPEQEATEDGMEIDIGVNFFGHFYLAHSVLDVLKTSVSKLSAFLCCSKRI
jgi:NAD(P)-dependent dehydrogenase (short-subunit alcohol dehydrogenase family)